ncbi:unnamed protein product [Lampetra fluviatilis]
MSLLSDLVSTLRPRVHPQTSCPPSDLVSTRTKSSLNVWARISSEAFEQRRRKRPGSGPRRAGGGRGVLEVASPSPSMPSSTWKRTAPGSRADLAKLLAGISARGRQVPRRVQQHHGAKW